MEDLRQSFCDLDSNCKGRKGSSCQGQATASKEGTERLGLKGAKLSARAAQCSARILLPCRGWSPGLPPPNLSQQGRAVETVCLTLSTTYQINTDNDNGKGRSLAKTAEEMFDFSFH